jgi:hypothetical protein
MYLQNRWDAEQSWPHPHPCQRVVAERKLRFQQFWKYLIIISREGLHHLSTSAPRCHTSNNFENAKIEYDGSETSFQLNIKGAGSIQWQLHLSQAARLRRAFAAAPPSARWYKNIASRSLAYLTNSFSRQHPRYRNHFEDVSYWVSLSQRCTFLREDGSK